MTEPDPPQKERLLALDNPFARPVVDGPRDMPATAPSIHKAEFERIVARFSLLAQQQRPRLKPGPLALLVRSQMPGSGKSHLLGRLWRELNGRAIVIFLRSHQDAQAFWRRILERLVQELQYPEATTQRALTDGAATQLDSLARHLLADLMDRAMQQGKLKASANASQRVREGSPEALNLIRAQRSALMAWLNQLVPTWTAQLSSAGLQLERDPVAWLKVLSSYTLHQPGEAPRSLALAWLQGHQLELEEAQELGLTLAQSASGIRWGDDSLNEHAFKCVKDLCALSAFFRPVVFAFDQTEMYGQSPELAHAFGATLGRLQAECINQMTIITTNEGPWLQTVSKHFERADLDRIDGEHCVIKGIDQAQARELLTVKLRNAGYADEDIETFLALPWLNRIFANVVHKPQAREVERAAGAALDAWRTGAGDGGAAAKVSGNESLEASFLGHLDRLRSTPKALDFDIGVLLWAFNTGLSRLDGVSVVEGFHSPKRRMQACWRVGRETIFFILDDSTHWKHWLGVVKDYHQHAQAERGQGRVVRGVVVRHRSLKPIPPGMQTQLDAPEARGLVVVDLSDEEMALPYAGQAVHADVCQGDLPGVAPAALLDFLGVRLRTLGLRFFQPMKGEDGACSGKPDQRGDTPTVMDDGNVVPPASPEQVRFGVQRQAPHAAVDVPLQLLTRHCAILGGTGSGKTTAALHLVEQVLQAGVPAVLLDRKGDLCRYADPQAWLDAHWPPAPHFDAARRSALLDRIDIRVFTPGALQGRGLRLPLAPAALAQLPPDERRQAAAESAAVLAQALGLTRKSDEPRRAVLLCVFELLAQRLPPGRGIGVDDILGVLGGDDLELMEAIGMIDAKVIGKLAEQVQTFKITNQPLLDERAESLDWSTLLQPRADGRIPLTIVSTKSLGGDAGALLWVAQFFLELLRHVSRFPSDRLQGLLLIDEADIYLPATREPATKRPLESLLKRARSGGVGLMLCTQSPGDLDYKGRENIRTWLMGLIRQERAREKLAGVLEEARIPAELLGRQKQGEFILATEAQHAALRALPNMIQTRQMSEAEILAVARLRG